MKASNPNNNKKQQNKKSININTILCLPVNKHAEFIENIIGSRFNNRRLAEYNNLLNNLTKLLTIIDKQ